MIESFVQSLAFFPEHSPGHRNARSFQDAERLALMLRVWVNGADDDAPDSGLDDGFGAGWCPAMGATGFETDVKGCSSGVVSFPRGILQSLDFGMGFACAMVPALPDDAPAFDEDRPHHRVRRDLAPTAPCQLNRPPDEANIPGIRFHGSVAQSVGKERAGKLFGVKRLQIIRLLAQADELDGQAKFFLNGHDHAAFTGAVQLGHH